MGASTLRVKNTLWNAFAVKVTKSIEEGNVYLNKTTTSIQKVTAQYCHRKPPLYELRAIRTRKLIGFPNELHRVGLINSGARGCSKN